MAQIEESGSGRTANIDLNLVPFIDLMSVLITFLLITAVWSQVSMIQLGSSIYGKKNEGQTQATPPPMADIPIRLDVKEFGFRLIVGADRFQLPKIAGAYDLRGLLERLKATKEKYPEKTDCVITVDEVLPYENLIIGMDTLIKGGFQTISIATTEAE